MSYPGGYNEVTVRGTDVVTLAGVSWSFQDTVLEARWWGIFIDGLWELARRVPGWMAPEPGEVERKKREGNLTRGTVTESFRGQDGIQ